MGKTIKFSSTYCQLEARNFEMAQHIDKQITEVSSAINAIRTISNLRGITLLGFDAI